MVRQVVSRGAAAALLGLLGWLASTAIGGRIGDTAYFPWGLVFTAFGVLLGASLGPYILYHPGAWALRKLDGQPAAVLMLGVVGLLTGLAAAALLNVALVRIPGTTGWVLPIAISLALGPAGAVLFIAQGRSVAEQVPALRSGAAAGAPSGGMILMDTSAIIDGRIMDVARTGFIQGTIGVPQFILDELRHIADSSDPMRRNRGRRGLETLNLLRQDPRVAVRILDVNGSRETEADAHLVQLARETQSSILTTDFNLNRVAEFQGVQVLNINELANALKPAVLAGEDMSVRVVQEGKEVGQGVAFLNDGTMIVIEGGKRHVNAQIDVTVTRMLQTSAGRIIFAKTKGA